ncbi:hypothetical protein [Ectopseudomonas guguanensis]|uniref:hypothetical protein n=1 Tax=Ectopseudomonas guguanensis TaxID=1198456 RepID=UPI00285C4870|nr:hypothetical protein [Pseudomonas guguanensis]MDR8013299.1 hypothetical protein [Pseudomonas guguanensis]
MYLYRDEAERLTEEMRQGLNKALRNISDQLLAFLEDTDWAMVIKLHAAIEATVTQVILAHTNQDVLRSVIERLPLSDNQTGKGRIAVELGLITSSQFSFLRKFSELRNNLVHRLENIDFDLRKHFEGMDKEQRKAWRKAIAWQDTAVKQEALAVMLDQNPKMALFLSVFTLVTLMTVAEQEYLVRRKVDFLSERTMRELVGDTSEGDGP